MESVKPLKVNKPKPLKEVTKKGMIRVSDFNRASFGSLFKKEKSR